MAKQQNIGEYLEQLEHPLRAAIDEVRAIVSGATSDVEEIVKWNAPTFTWHGEYLATIHVKSLDRIMVIFHNAVTPLVSSNLLEGEYTDGRRMAYFADRDDVIARADELRDVVRQLVGLLAKN